jgi:enamine deaminase RidA (YjgF/YER057c/UK114 family)
MPQLLRSAAIRVASLILLAAGFVMSMLVPAPLHAQQTTDPEARLAQLGIELPTPARPVANYVQAVRTGNLVFLAGHGPVGTWDKSVTGKVGRDLTVEQGYEAARRTGVNLLASLKAEIGDLRKVTRIVRVFGMVNSADGFTQQPAVINGCSDLMVAVFGDRGKHARAAVGMAELPLNWAVEIEMVVEVSDQ